MNVAIETHGLTKYYGRARGCQDISLTVPAGSIFGFLGPNGAGKSTVVKLLVGLLEPTAGHGEIFGHPIGSRQAKALLGFLPEHYRMPEWPKAVDLLAFYGRLSGLEPDRKRLLAVLEQVGLREAADRRVSTFSNGMRQRLALGAALLHRPRLLILDEPTAALDPLGRRFVRTLLRELQAEGVTVFLNSHLLSELEQLCDHLAVIRAGQVVAEGSMADLAGRKVEVTLWAEPLAPEQLAAFGPVTVLPGGRLRVILPDSDKVPDLAAAIVQAGARLHELVPRHRSLEDLFVDLVTAPEEASADG
jgi:ABC-2 type transport system ATP-binding protein